MAQSYEHDPDAKLDYYIDWAAWLGGDTIESSTWAVTGSTSVLLSLPEVFGQLTQIWVEGGSVGEAVDVINHIVTGLGREEDRTFRLIIRDH